MVCYQYSTLFCCESLSCPKVYTRWALLLVPEKSWQDFKTKKHETTWEKRNLKLRDWMKRRKACLGSPVTAMHPQCDAFNKHSAITLLYNIHMHTHTLFLCICCATIPPPMFSQRLRQLPSATSEISQIPCHPWMNMMNSVCTQGIQSHQLVRKTHDFVF